ncbi:MAG TPA: response regulator [Rhabdochlamydiaceae bacterium]
MDNPVVLLISSDETKISFFKRVLKESFYFITALEGTAGKELLKNMLVDLIIIDGKLNDVFSLSNEIRKMSGCQEIPILLLTNVLKKSFLDQAFKAGINDFVNEPLVPDEIYQRLSVALKARSVQKKTRSVAGRIKTPKIAERPEPIHKGFVFNAEMFKGPKPLTILMIDAEASPPALAGFLKRQLRQLDTVVPQGKNKFLILLPKTSERAGIAIAGSIKKDAEKDLELTLTIGILCFDENFEKLLAKVPKVKP